MSSKKRAHSRKNRVYVFREFLLQTYNINRTITDSVSSQSQSIVSNENSGSRTEEETKPKKINTILDIAGGKGDLSWILMNVGPQIHQSIIVDPRLQTNHNHLIKSIQYLTNHPNEVDRRSIKNSDTYQPIAALIHKIPLVYCCFNNTHDTTNMSSDTIDEYHSFQTPKHLRLFINEEFVQSINYVIQYNDESLWNLYWETQMSTSSSTEDATVASDSQEALKVIKSTNLVVGFHPDHATEYIIDLAILLKVPFCIVPCCVFPSEFPWRRIEKKDSTSDGGVESVPVRTYDDFILYLQAKHNTCIRKDYLEFYETSTARNVVLYTLLEDMI